MATTDLRAHAASAASSATQNASSGLEMLARLGYCSRGAIYLIIGVLAVLAIFDSSGETTGSRGALTKVLQAPGGWILLAVIAVGLVGYSVWRFCQSLLDADDRGADGKAILVRIGYFISALTHLGLAFWAGTLVYRIVTSGGGAAAASGSGAANGASGDSSSSKETLIAWLMSQPFGQWLVGLVGLIVIGVGIHQFKKGYDKKYEERLKWEGETRRKLSPVCQLGLIARGVVFCILGGFIIYAAITTDPEKAGGVPQALQWLRDQPYGTLLFGATALGLAAFGVFGFIQGIYRRVEAPG